MSYTRGTAPPRHSYLLRSRPKAGSGRHLQNYVSRSSSFSLPMQDAPSGKCIANREPLFSCHNSITDCPLQHTFCIICRFWRIICNFPVNSPKNPCHFLQHAPGLPCASRQKGQKKRPVQRLHRPLPRTKRSAPSRLRRREGALGYRFGVRRNHVTGNGCGSVPVSIEYPILAKKILSCCEHSVNFTKYAVPAGGRGKPCRNHVIFVVLGKPVTATPACGPQWRWRS